MCIVFDWGIGLNDLIHTAGEGLTLPLFSVFMSRVLLEYTYFMCFICFYGSPMYKSFPELEAHETLKKSGFSKCNIKTLYTFFFNNCKTPCDGSKLFFKLALCFIYVAIYPQFSLIWSIQRINGMPFLHQGLCPHLTC